MIYTRVSTEQGLEQDFNSLDAQREACKAYIKSQAHEGWRLVRDRYDDGGFSGGSMDRPALQKLLADVEARRIDVIVVYKVDRLTRIRDHNPLYMRRDHRSHRGCVAGRFDDHVLLRKLLCESLEKMAAAHGDAPQSFELAVVPGDRLGEGAVDIQSDDAHAPSVPVRSKRELAGNTTSTDPRSRCIRESRKGRPCNELGLSAHCLSAACPQALSCLDVYGPRPIATGLANAGPKVTTADVYPASLCGVSDRRRRRREPRWIFARFHLNVAKALAEAMPVQTPGSGSDGVTVSPSSANRCNC